MPFAALSVVLQIALAVHAVQSGRDRQWIYILLIPVIGPALYIITQLIPDMMGNPGARKAARRLVHAMDPQRELRKRKEELERADTVDNRRKLAAECLEAGLSEEAVDLYGFTSVLKRTTDEEERLAIVEMMWEIVYADGHVHEFEDNTIWRVAELLGVSTRDRMTLRHKVAQTAPEDEEGA